MPEFTSTEKVTTTVTNTEGARVVLGFTFETPESLTDWLAESQGEDYLAGWLLRRDGIRREIVRVLAGGSAGWSTGFPDWNEKLRMETLEAAGNKMFKALADKLADAVEKADTYYHAYYKLYHWIHGRARDGAFSDYDGYLAQMPLKQHVGVFSPESKAAEAKAREYIEVDLIPAMRDALGIAKATKGA